MLPADSRVHRPKLAGRCKTAQRELALEETNAEYPHPILATCAADVPLLFDHQLPTDSSDEADFKRTQDFTIEDFDLVARLICWFGKLIATPHVLSQVSDLTDLPGKGNPRNGSPRTPRFGFAQE
jgi:hypothetical protein